MAKSKRQILTERSIRKQNRNVKKFSREMEEAMEKAVNEIWSNFEETRRFKRPALKEMDDISEGFYRRTITSAVDHCEDEKEHIDKIADKNPTKRLAKLPTGLPNKLRSLEQIFRNRRYWPKILKRSRALTRRLRESYLDKLEKKFNRILPRILAGETSPREVKEQLMEAWDASQNRVETIFRTESTKYFAKTQVAYFQSEPDVLGFLFDSVSDTSRTPICKSREGLIYRPGTKLLRTNTPPCHFNCRSHLIPLANTAMNREMMRDHTRDPSIRVVIPLPKGWKSN